MVIDTFPYVNEEDKSETRNMYIETSLVANDMSDFSAELDTSCQSIFSICLCSSAFSAFSAPLS